MKKDAFFGVPSVCGYSAQSTLLLQGGQARGLAKASEEGVGEGR